MSAVARSMRRFGHVSARSSRRASKESSNAAANRSASLCAGALRSMAFRRRACALRCSSLSTSSAARVAKAFAMDASSGSGSAFALASSSGLSNSFAPPTPRLSSCVTAASRKGSSASKRESWKRQRPSKSSVYARAPPGPSPRATCTILAATPTSCRRSRSSAALDPPRSSPAAAAAAASASSSGSRRRGTTPTNVVPAATFPEASTWSTRATSRGCVSTSFIADDGNSTRSFRGRMPSVGDSACSAGLGSPAKRMGSAKGEGEAGGVARETRGGGAGSVRAKALRPCLSREDAASGTVASARERRGGRCLGGDGRRETLG